MSSDEQQVQNIYRYYRKTYNKNRRGTQDTDINSHDGTNGNDVPENSPRSEAYTVDSPGCSCDLDREGDIANILHKKCPVITLAQQQLVRLLDETNRLVVDNNRNWSPLYNFLCVCKELAICHNKSQSVLIGFIFLSFFFGLLLGAASCGTNLGQFNSPILNCIDNYFVPDEYISIEDTFRSIA